MATAREKVEAIQLKTARAEKHINDLEVVVRQFRFGSPAPYKVRTKHDQQTRELLYYISRLQQLSPDIPVIIGDALQNLRAALDHLAYQLFLIGSAGKQPPTTLSFPVFNSPAEYEAGKIGKIDGLRKDAIKFIDDIKPYKGGNNTLWGLHKLNNIDKHRLLITVASSYQGRSLTEHEKNLIRRTSVAAHRAEAVTESDLRNGIAAPAPSEWNAPLHLGYVFHRAPPNSEVDENVKPEINVTFGEPKIIDREPVIETLTDMLHAVEAVVADGVNYL